MREKLLYSLSLPQDLKALSVEDAKQLAKEVRRLIVDVVSSNGGHLAPSLGVVELTIALLSAMDVPKDRIVWDVGHQCYAYKILTDRLSSFHTLRQPGGISGFPKPEESAYDAFATGHASTSISAALGIAQGRDLMGQDYAVTAVIGDGALGGGMAWEAMNNAGASGANLLVILNDNRMSISASCGALAAYIADLRTMPFYRTVEDGAERFFKTMPLGGGLISKASKMLKRGLTTWVSPTSGTIFEALGFEYLGPVDGHDIGLLRRVISQARAIKGPVLLHVVTTKGKGYFHAEHNARQFHGVAPFHSGNGKPSGKGKRTYTDIFGKLLVELAGKDQGIVAITAAMPDGTGLNRFAVKYPGRFFNVGIAEGHAVTFAAGLAASGMKPVVAAYSTFLQRGYDQIVHDVCLQNLHVVFALDRAGIVGEDGPTHHGIYDLSYLRHMPNLTIMAPRNAADLCDMLYTALKMQGPVAVRYPRGEATGVKRGALREIPLGKAEVLREGSDAAILAVGTSANFALDAADELEKRGISARVINARFVKPLDETAVLDAASKCGAMVIAEENSCKGGFSSSVLECLAKNNRQVNGLEIVALPDAFISHGNAAEIRGRYELNSAGIANAVIRALEKTGRLPAPSEEEIVIPQSI